MANDQTIYDDERSNDAEMMEALAEHQYFKSEKGYTDWLYKNYPIGNGHQLVNLLEYGNVIDPYLSEVGLPLDTELDY